MKTIDSTMECLSGWITTMVGDASSSTLPIRVGQFESMWIEEFDTLDNLPQEVKDTVARRYEYLRANRKD